MEKPFTRSPQFWAFSSHILPQSPQNLQVKFLIDSLSRRNEFPMHNSSNIRKNNERLFHIWPHLSCFFRSRWSGGLPLAESLFGLRVVPIASTFFARDDLRKKVWVTFNLIFQLLAQRQTSVFLVLCEQAGNKLRGNASHVQIHGQNPLTGTPPHTCSFWDLVNCVPMILVNISRIFSTFLSVRLVDGRQEWGWSSTLISPLLNHTDHLKTCVWLSASSLNAFWSISCASVAVFPRWKQNLKQIRCLVQSDITISQEELDNTWENWEHKPVQPSTATSAWLLTHEGCNYTHLAGEHSTTIRKRTPKPVRFFLGPPTYTIIYL